MVNTKVAKIEHNIIYAVNTKDPEEKELTITTDTIVNALGSRKNVFDTTDITIPVTLVGDCAGPHTADISSAIRSGYRAGQAI